ncbi:MAG TPA: hypothetical protein ENH32_08350 [Proteobacteria bacterium]|nr:hypothetical protein BMS3Abin14_02039 [bacterium BMS3Abin14]HDL53972.1 hypothetical protein [Pseudomonadota bacterium]
MKTAIFPRVAALLIVFPLMLFPSALLAQSVDSQAAAKSSGPVSVNLNGLDGLWVATSAGTLPEGSFVVGGGFVFGNGKFGPGGGYSTYAVPVTVTYAFTDRIEGGASAPVIMNVDPDVGATQSGFGDVNLSIKYSLQAETQTMPAYAVGARLKLGTASDANGLGTGDTDLGIFAALDQQIGGVHGYLNVEYALRGGNMDNEVNYALGLKIPYTDSVDFTVELVDQGFITSEYNFGDILIGGASFDMAPSVNFGFAVGLGLNDNSSDFLLGGKLSFSL